VSPTCASDEQSQLPLPWYRRPELVRQLPLLSRWWATYARVVGRHDSETVFGGSYLLRRLDGLSRACRLRRTAIVQINGFDACLRAFDVSAASFLSDVCGRTRIHRAMQTVLREGDTFLDVGANHGAYSLLASRLVGVEGRVVAVEPFEELANCVEDSLRRNLRCDWTVLRTALSDREGEQEFLFDPCGSGNGSLYAWNPSRHLVRCRVPCTTLDRIATWDDWPGHVFVKLDVEGAETAFLRGGAVGIHRFKPTILFEATPATEHSLQSLANLLKTLCELGYRQFVDTRDMRSLLSADQLDLSAPRDILAMSERGFDRWTMAVERTRAEQAIDVNATPCLP
jgi:FkbM family methyltransferase